MSNIRKFITALASPFQLLEDTINALILQRNVNYAVGVQLDQLGALVGQPRNGIADDDVYRRYVRARIATNKSDGQPETLYRIARLVLGETDHTLAIDNLGHAGLVMRVGGIALPYALAEILIAFLRQGVSGGVRVILEFSTLPPDETFSLEDGDGLGFESFDETTGGGWADSLE